MQVTAVQAVPSAAVVCKQAPPPSQPSLVHGLPSSQVLPTPAHLPAPQTSLLVQLLLSSQARVLLVNVQPLTASQTSVVQTFLSSQTVLPPPRHLPLLQASLAVQGSPSSHGLVLGLNTQPAMGSQLSVVQELLSLQGRGAPATHRPPPHLSFCVHKLPSSQLPSTLRCWQPLTTSQESVVQTFLSSQLVTPVPAHLPPPQRSPLVHAFWSSQAAAVLVNTQPLVGSQESAVQAFLSSHTTWLEPMQLAPVQTSPLVQALLSSHIRELAVCSQPLTASQESLVQPFLSSQLMIFPEIHRPLLQVSPAVHALLSLQGVLLLALVQPLAPSQMSVVQPLPSSQLVTSPGKHTPAVQVEAAVWLSPAQLAARQTVPASKSVCTQPFTLSQESPVHGLLSSQFTGLVIVQAPAAHVSPVVQASLSSQLAELLALLQPLAGSQASSVQGLPSPQLIASPGTHAVSLQLSPRVQALLSEQTDVLATCKQPLAMSQESSVHGFLSSQFGAMPPTHLPPAQVSAVVQALPSSQAAVLSTVEQPLVGSQESVVQPFLSSHTLAAPGWHLPAVQRSTRVQALLSSQGEVLLLVAHLPVLGSHKSSVHGLLSLQTTAAPETQLPPWHLSPLVQPLPSSQAAPASRALLTHFPPRQVSAVQAFLSSQSASALQLQVLTPPHRPATQTSPVVQAMPSSHLAVLAALTQPRPAWQASSVHGLPSSHDFA